MAFRLEPPAIKLDQIQWDAVGDDDAEKEARLRLLAHIQIAGVDMHLEARAVDPDADIQQLLVFDEDLQKLSAVAGDVSFETVMIGERDYVIFALPYGV
ncbi:MAG: hypothetical protein DI537_14610 [Stutzerimonas stutzeri]|nr:MAG: hypothetical protein DI537_14610 [Stutzerimonas stutzeri]